MVYRAIKTCSTYNALDVEFVKIRERAVENEYPIVVVESMVWRH